MFISIQENKENTNKGKFLILIIIWYRMTYTNFSKVIIVVWSTFLIYIFLVIDLYIDGKWYGGTYIWLGISIYVLSISIPQNLKTQYTLIMPTSMTMPEDDKKK